MPIQVHGIRELAGRLGRIDADLIAELRPAILEAAELVKARAQQNASFSSDIPSRITASANFSSGRGGAEVRVAEFGYPHQGKAAVFEGNGEAPSPFMHPTYGHGPVEPQMTHPFLGPAAEEEHDAAVAIIAAAVAKAFDL